MGTDMHCHVIDHTWTLLHAGFWTQIFSGFHSKLINKGQCLRTNQIPLSPAEETVGTTPSMTGWISTQKSDIFIHDLFSKKIVTNSWIYNTVLDSSVSFHDGFWCFFFKHGVLGRYININTTWHLITMWERKKFSWQIRILSFPVIKNPIWFTNEGERNLIQSISLNFITYLTPSHLFSVHLCLSLCVWGDKDRYSAVYPCQMLSVYQAFVSLCSSSLHSWGHAYSFMHVPRSCHSAGSYSHASETAQPWLCVHSSEYIKLSAFDALLQFACRLIDGYPSLACFTFDTLKVWKYLCLCMYVFLHPLLCALAVCYIYKHLLFSVYLMQRCHLVLVVGVGGRGRQWSWAEICQTWLCSPTLLPLRNVWMKVKSQSLNTRPYINKKAHLFLGDISHASLTFPFRYSGWRFVIQRDQSTIPGQSQSRAVLGF